jgi:adenylate cyclase
MREPVVRDDPFRPASGDASGGRAARVLAWSARPFGAAVVALALIGAGVLLAAVPALRNADLALLDLRFAVLARHAPLAAADSVAIVGVDEASLAALDEPLSLLLRPLASAIEAIAGAQPRAIALDIVLPERAVGAYAPGSDMAMASALVSARRRVPIVIGLTTRDDGSVRPVAPALVAAAASSGLAVLPADADGRVRRFDEQLAAGGQSVPTLVGEVARALGIAVGSGVIQYALGDGYDYVPLRDVLAWHANGDSQALAEAFRGRTVIVGAVLPYEDRFAQPVPLARFDRTRDVPGVLVHAQALRSLEAGALVRPAGSLAQLALLALAASLWFVKTWPGRVIALVAFAAAAFVASTLLLRNGVDLSPGAALRVAFTAVALRSALEAWQARQERTRLRMQFGGYVSPPVLDAILDGRLDEDARRGRRRLAFLFADVRDFVAVSASRTPEEVLALLNRYFGAMTPVLHARGATIDNFRGDGLMALFGAPNLLPDPASAATAAARDMLDALGPLNAGLAEAGLPPLSIGVTLAIGEAVVGNVGSRERFNYTALGNGANIAARLQEVCRATGYPIVATHELVATADEVDRWDDLGVVAVRGLGDVRAFGWKPA